MSSILILKKLPLLFVRLASVTEGPAPLRKYPSQRRMYEEQLRNGYVKHAITHDGGTSILL